MPAAPTRISGNVYHAVDGRYTKFISLDREKILDSRNHEILIDDGKISVLLDKDAPDYEDMFRSKGTKLPADEILDLAKPGALRLPMKTREDFRSDELGLPDSELLKVLHYFTSKKLLKSPLVKKFDEGALLALGLLVEQWVDELVDESTMKLFGTFETGEDVAEAGGESGGESGRESGRDSGSGSERGSESESGQEDYSRDILDDNASD